MENYIVIDNVCKRFKDEEILKNITISFEKGKTYGIIGKNGSGKTVLLKIISGLMTPDSGTVFVSNKQIGKDCDFPDSIGVIIEAPGFLSHYSGFKNLKYLADLTKKADAKKVKETMRIVGLDPESRKPVGKYSLGMRQRLGIAQAIMEDPDLLLLDEPMNGLDKKGVSDMYKLFSNLKQESKTIILVSHSTEDISNLCDIVYEMDEGQLLLHK